MDGMEVTFEESLCDRNYGDLRFLQEMFMNPWKGLPWSQRFFLIFPHVREPRSGERESRSGEREKPRCFSLFAALSRGEKSRKTSGTRVGKDC